MKYALFGLLALFTLTTGALAQESDARALTSPDVKILNADEITKLHDKDLLDAYVNTSVEIEALKSFHSTSGYMPKEYAKFKDLLRYRIWLLNEIKKRKLEAPVVQ